jgi:acetylornithine deacetylase/succinyl-diaminopimelate desuccinylase-like protein
MKGIINIIKKNRERYLEELAEYVSIQSISTLSEKKEDIGDAAKWIAERMKKAGLENIKLIKTKGNPIVYGDWLHQKSKPTVLFYGHYDVQPPDPLKQWKTEPFKLVIKGGQMYARGVGDNKGPHLSHVLGIETLLKTRKDLPVNVKFLIEGEEEIGSSNITPALKNNKKLFKSDIAFVSDGIMGFDNPVVEYGLRGLIGFEIHVTCLEKDVHSGIYGGVVDNAPMVLAYIISKLKDRKGKILIPGIYKKVRKVSSDERKLLKKAEYSSSEILKNTGAKKVFGEGNFINIERIGARPSLDVNGIQGGFQGEGLKTIIPSKASAKLSMRIVPNMKSTEIVKLIKTYIKKISPKTCKVDIVFQESGDPTLFDYKSSSLKVAEDVLRDLFEAEPNYKLIGGSIGAVGAMKQILGIDSVLTGLSYPDSNWHSPNEKMKVENFFKGIELTVKYLEKLAGID